MRSQVFHFLGQRYWQDVFNSALRLKYFHPNILQEKSFCD